MDFRPPLYGNFRAVYINDKGGLGTTRRLSQVKVYALSESVLYFSQYSAVHTSPPQKK